MKIWLDDVRKPPKGWVWCKWPQEVIQTLQSNPGLIEEVSLDHDLGDDSHGTGYDVITWIENRIFDDESFIPPKKIKIHSANTAARKRMKAGLESCAKHSLHKIII